MTVAATRSTGNGKLAMALLRTSVDVKGRNHDRIERNSGVLVGEFLVPCTNLAVPTYRASARIPMFCVVVFLRCGLNCGLKTALW